MHKNIDKEMRDKASKKLRLTIVLPEYWLEYNFIINKNSLEMKNYFILMFCLLGWVYSQG